jgi:hypothetical protein
LEGNAYIGELFSAIVFVIVGARLLGLSRRTREAPELILGAAFLMSGVALGLYMVPYMKALESLWIPFTFGGRALFIPVSILFALFTRAVFRPNEGWATGLVWAIGGLHLLGVGGGALTGDWEGFDIRVGWFWLEWSGYTIPVAWTGLEALSQYGQARRRVRLGLCGPLVCNRMLLWGLFGALQVLLSIVVVFQYAAYSEADVFTPGWDLLYGVFSTTSVVMIWFAFFPPVFYKRWIERSTDPAASEQR